MIYIHKLADLNPKSIEIESVPIIREIRRDPAREPVTFLQRIEPYFITEGETELLAQGATETIEALSIMRAISAAHLECHEPVSVERTLRMLSELVQPLGAQAAYAAELKNWEGQLAGEFTQVLARIKQLRTQADMQECNAILQNIFRKILRCDDMRFNYDGIIGDNGVEHGLSFKTGMENGFLFKKSLEEELQKLSFAHRRRNIPAPELLKADELEQKFKIIKAAVDSSYEHNLRMIELTVLLYSYLKYIKE